MGFKFGSFDSICQTAALPVCPMLGTSQGMEPTCYSRNVDLGGTTIFQPGVCFVHIIALIMTFIMVLHIRSKYTAVGRKEIVMFFYVYAVIEFLSIFLDSGIIPTSHTVYPWFASVHVGLICAIFWILLANGFIGFQFAEDGTPMSLWGLRISTFVVWGVTFFVSIATLKGFASFSYEKPIGLFIVLLVFPIVCVAIYVVSQLILVIRTLDDRWVIGDILFGVGFFAVGCVVLFAFSVTVCDAVEHYIDGLFFFALCMLLSVMMVYKYWDSITKEDLEFAVGDKGAVWEVKEYGHDLSLLAPPNAEFVEEDQSQYGGSLVGGMGGNQYYGSQGSRGNYSNYPPSGSSQGHGSAGSKQGFYNANGGGQQRY